MRLQKTKKHGFRITNIDEGAADLCGLLRLCPLSGWYRLKTETQKDRCCGFNSDIVATYTGHEDDSGFAEEAFRRGYKRTKKRFLAAPNNP